MNIADDFLRGRLLPQKSEGECRNELYDLGCIEPDFDPTCRLSFEYPQVSNKVKLAKRLVDNAINKDLNNLFASLESNCTQERVLYKLMKIKRAIKPALQNIQTHIDDGRYWLKAFANKNARYGGIDAPFYENVYVSNYVQRILIWYALEFQGHFIKYIPEDKRLSLDTIFIEFLQMPVPDESFIIPITRIEAETTVQTEPEIDLNVDVEKMPTNAQIFYEEVQKYNFTNLPKMAAISGNKQSILITKTLSHDMPYVIAMLDYLGYPKYLKDNYRLNKEQIYKHVATALGVSNRQVKGNFLVLKEGSNENTTRYSAFQFKTAVKDDYETLIN